MKADRRQKQGRKELILQALKGAVMGLIVTIVGVLIFAVIIKESGAEDQLVSAVNQILKVVSIFIAAWIGTRSLTQGQIPAGILAGVAYVLLGTLGDIPMLLADVAMAAVIGMLTALIFSKLGISKKTPKKAHR